MSNVQLVRDAYDCFGRGDIPTLLGMMDPNMQWSEAKRRILTSRAARLGMDRTPSCRTCSVKIGADLMEPSSFIQRTSTMQVTRSSSKGATQGPSRPQAGLGHAGLPRLKYAIGEVEATTVRGHAPSGDEQPMAQALGANFSDCTVRREGGTHWALLSVRSRPTSGTSDRIHRTTPGFLMRLVLSLVTHRRWTSPTADDKERTSRARPYSDTTTSRKTRTTG